MDNAPREPELPYGFKNEHGSRVEVFSQAIYLEVLGDNVYMQTLGTQR